MAQTVDTMGKVRYPVQPMLAFSRCLVGRSYSDETWQRIIDVNLPGHFLSCPRVVPEMKKLQEKARSSTMVPSLVIRASPMLWPPRGQQNGGVHDCEVLAVELAPYKISVNAIAPGNVVTPDPLYQFMAGDSTGTSAEWGKKALGQFYPVGKVGGGYDITPAAHLLRLRRFRFCDRTDLVR